MRILRRDATVEWEGSVAKEIILPDHHDVREGVNRHSQNNGWKGTVIHTDMNPITTRHSTIQNGRQKKRKPRPHNPAMKDAKFLRKRTKDILKATEYTLGEYDETAEPPAESISSKNMKVDKKTFHFLLDSWAFSGEQDAPDQAKSLLERMEQMRMYYLHIRGSEKNIQPDVRSYTKTINAVARAARPDAGDEAEVLLGKLNSLYKETADPTVAATLKPNAYTYTAVLRAHCNGGASDAADRVVALTESMLDLYERGDADVCPSAKTFNAAIQAYGKNGQGLRAAGVFQRMEQLYEAGISTAKPNAMNYNSLITAWAHNACEAEDSAMQAENVLKRMLIKFQRTGDESIQPTTVSFNAVLDAYAKSASADAAQKAEGLLRRMEENQSDKIKPNTRSFNSVINAWAKSRHEDAAANAEAFLETMERRFEKGDKDVRPDVHSFCTVINGEFDMVLLAKIVPSQSCMISPTTAYARSAHPDKAERAFNIYKDMKVLYQEGNENVRPNVVAGNAVLNACAFASDIQHQNRAIEIANAMLKELEQSGRPDQVTYGTFMKVCANLMSESPARQQIVEIIFKKCASNGQVGNLVLQQFQSLASPEVYERLTGKSDLNEPLRVEDLPKDWSCNVIEGKWRRRRALN